MDIYLEKLRERDEYEKENLGEFERIFPPEDEGKEEYY